MLKGAKAKRSEHEERVTFTLRTDTPDGRETYKMLQAIAAQGQGAISLLMRNLLNEYRQGSGWKPKDEPAAPPVRPSIKTPLASFDNDDDDIILNGR